MDRRTDPPTLLTAACSCPPPHTQVAHAPLRAGFSLAPVSRSEKPLPKRREGACESGPPPSGRSPMGTPIPLNLSTELDTFSHRLLKALLGPLLTPVSVARSHHTWALNPNKPNKERRSKSHPPAAGPAMKMGTWQLTQEMTCPCSHKQSKQASSSQHPLLCLLDAGGFSPGSLALHHSRERDEPMQVLLCPPTAQDVATSQHLLLWVRASVKVSGAGLCGRSAWSS